MNRRYSFLIFTVRTMAKFPVILFYIYCRKNRIMRKISFWIFTVLITSCCSNYSPSKADWLIDGSSFKSSIAEKDGFVTISNGLITRTFTLKPDGATVSLKSLITGKELLRAVKPEAEITINNKTMRVGGLTGQPVNNFLKKEWIPALKPDSLSPFRLSGYNVGEIQARFKWKKRAEWMSQDMPWPPAGKRIDFTYLPKENFTDFAGIRIVIHYEIYDGIPLISKWMSVENETGKEIIINSFTSEILAMVEEESSVGDLKNGFSRMFMSKPTTLSEEVCHRVHVMKNRYGGCLIPHTKQ